MNKKFFMKIDKMNRCFFFILFFFLAGLVNTNKNFAEPNDSYITTEKSEGAFTLSEAGKSSPLFVSPEDYPGVMLVAKLLQTDIRNVTNAEPTLSTISSEKTPEGKEIILIGTLGKNSLIDQLVKDKKLDVKDIEGKWETFLIQVVKNPFPNVDHALVITGSDKRGTIYGMFDLSEKIGVFLPGTGGQMFLLKRKIMFMFYLSVIQQENQK